MGEKSGERIMKYKVVRGLVPLMSKLHALKGLRLLSPTQEPKKLPIVPKTFTLSIPN
jgi:hypothetical protein